MSRGGVWYLTCRNSPEEIGRARRWTRDVLRGQPLADDAALIVSELGTNALLHSASGRQAGTFRITLALTADALTISVTDQGSPTAPRMERPGSEATHGRGLGMVSTLADRIEITGDHHGRTVTAQLPMPRTGDPSVPEVHHGYRCECHIQSPTTGGTPKLVAVPGKP
jgi:anti-sigma regulatory factor (Ser/Thr protein kinase)